ncbi:DUF3248 domain-containing protein [Oceanithermus desulfurans]|uniref:DUF3248 domain-containing protein n=2 Tax=Oceanithermus desulfurans TaxID=227924 RepID=A0A511RGV2_9DEIN|nr:DUF3248 domain-containing protein [Oceanithermus desulfurans]MBB6028811.1 hypothetical protein [Oceanithermus desulfurans]GEM88870.1 hypothetical protein ODE01S_03040 [Oceanithermus desulfurans NBRC 100063]
MSEREESRAEALPDELQRRLGELGEYLVWRIGTNEAEDVLIVRVGLASNTPRFNELPTLRNLGERKIEELVKEGRVRVEWVE